MEFKKVDVIEYVNRLLFEGEKAKLFVKSTPVHARKAVEGEVVETYVKNKETGELQKETENIAKAGDWYVVNKSKEAYLVSSEDFHKLYGPSEKEGIRMAMDTPRKHILVKENISFEAPWGGEMNIQAGGWLNITDMSKIYGINPVEFNETFTPVKEQEEQEEEELVC